jgi:class 3 adenylate cyclase
MKPSDVLDLQPDDLAGAKTTTIAELAVRIGIATGLVVVGGLSREGALREHTVVGDTPNIAARLQALAEPGTVVVAASTRRLLGDLFREKDLANRRPPMPSLITMLGGTIAAVCSRCQLQRKTTIIAPSTSHATT